ncbi:hypothetical protein L6V77_15225 [Myxococcota bacterium]|nr:hypothetical protein [Myxococcota bacterium]
MSSITGGADPDTDVQMASGRGSAAPRTTGGTPVEATAEHTRTNGPSRR